MSRLHFLFPVISVLSLFWLAEGAAGDFSAELDRAEDYLEDEQFARAEQIYGQVLAGSPADSNDALKSQRQLAYLYIVAGEQAKAGAAFAELTARFADHPGIAQAVWQVGGAYFRTGQYAKAREIHQYNVESNAGRFALWSQVEIVKTGLRAGEHAAADAAFDKLMLVFSQEPTLPKEIYQVADAYKAAKRYDKADELYQYGLDNQSAAHDAFWVQASLAVSNLELGDETAAQDAIGGLLAGFSDDARIAQTVYELANRYNSFAQPDKALQLHQYNSEHFAEDMYAMWSQVELFKSKIRDGDDGAADAAVERLLTVFSQQPTLPKEIYQIVDSYREARRDRKADELCAYVAEHWPESEQAVLAQKDMVILHNELGNQAAAEAALEKLLGEFSERQALPQALHELGRYFAGAGRPEKGVELHKYNVDHFSADRYGMWSQVETIYTHIRDGNEANATAAFEKLLTLFADEPTLPKEIYQVGDEYGKAGRSDKAVELYQYVINNWPDTEHEMWAKTRLERQGIRLQDETAPVAEVGELVADFNDQSSLPQALFTVGEEYYEKALRHDREGLVDESRQDFHKAIGIWERIITDLPEISPTTAEAYYFSARCYELIGEYEKAIEYYRQVTANLPEPHLTAPAYYFWAGCHSYLAQYEQAKAVCQQLMQKYPDNELSARARTIISRLDLSTLSREERDKAISLCAAQHDSWLGIRSMSARYTATMSLFKDGECVKEYPGSGSFELLVTPSNGPIHRQNPATVQFLLFNETNGYHYLADSILDPRAFFVCWPAEPNASATEVRRAKNQFIDVAKLLLRPLAAMAATYRNHVWDNTYLTSRNGFFAYRGTPIRLSEQAETDSIFNGEPQYLFVFNSRPAEAQYWFSTSTGELRQIHLFKPGHPVRILRYEDYVGAENGNVRFPRIFSCTLKERNGHKPNGWAYVVELRDVRLNIEIPPERFVPPGGSPP